MPFNACIKERSRLKWENQEKSKKNIVWHVLIATFSIHVIFKLCFLSSQAGFTALMLAAALRHDKIVEFLLQKGADANIADSVCVLIWTV